MALKSSITCWAAVLLALSSALNAQIEVDAFVGFDGVISANGIWPLTVRVTNGGSEARTVRLVLDNANMGQGVIQGVVERTLEVSPGVARQTTFLQCGPIDYGRLLRVATRRGTAISFRVNGAVAERAGVTEAGCEIDQFATRLRTSGRIAVFLGAKARQAIGALTPAKAADGLGQARLTSDGWDVGVGLLEVEALPDSELAWSGVHTIYWTEPDLAALAGTRALRAIEDWTAAGGRLVILAANRPDILNTEDVLRLTGCRVVGGEKRKLGFVVGVNDLAGAVLSIGAPSSAVASTPKGSAVPACFVRTLGRGAVVTAAFDPFAYDRSSPHHLASALGTAAGIDLRFLDDESRGQAYYGYRNVNAAGRMNGFGGGLLNGILTNGNIRRPPLAIFILGGILFVALVGPIDYVMLKRRKKLHWSPWTLLVYTAGFTAICVGSTFFIFAAAAETNRIAVVDLFEGSDGTERIVGDLYHGFFSPTGGSFVVGVADENSFFTQGTRADRWGRSGLVGAPRQIVVGPGRQAAIVDIPFNSFRSIETRFVGPAQGTLAVEATPAANGVSLRVTNGFAFPVEAIEILRESGIDVVAERLAPGASAEVLLPETAAATWDDVDRLRSGGMNDFGPVHEGMTASGRVVAAADVPLPAAIRRAFRSHTAGAMLMQSGDNSSAMEYSADRVGDVTWAALPTNPGPKDAVLMAVARALPVADRPEDAPSGFTYSILRRRLRLP